MSGRTRRRPLWQRKVIDLAQLAGVGLLCWALFRSQVPTALWVVIAVFVLCLWWLVLIPTYCDSVKRSNRAELCTLQVRGKLRGCDTHHARDKRDAVWSLLNRRNPGMIFRVGWSGPGSAVGATPAQAQAASNASRDSWMLVLTAVSAVAGVLGAAFTAIV